MKKLVLFLMFVGFCGLAYAQTVNSNPNQPVNIPCDNTADCQARVQYENDMQSLLTAKQNDQEAQAAVLADINSYISTRNQAQLATDTAKLTTLRANNVSIGTATPITGSLNAS